MDDLKNVDISDISDTDIIKKASIIKYLDYWVSKCNKNKLKLLDRIYFDAEQIDRWTDAVLKTDYFSNETLLNPSIKEIILCDKDSGQIFCFCKTLFDKDDFYYVDIKKEIRIDIVPIIDVVVFNSIKELDDPLGIYVLASSYITKIGENECLSGTTEIPIIDNRESRYERAECARYLKLMYLAIQMLSIERPSIFINKTTTKEYYYQTVKKKDKYKSIKSVRMVKHLYIDTNINNLCFHSKHKMTCECWGVAGHWRTYKNGKKIWIKPYKKGKERNNALIYSPKNYKEAERRL